MCRVLSIVCRLAARPVTAVAGLSLAVSGASAQPAAPPVPTDSPSEADWKLTLQARQALWDEDAVTAANVGVRIRQGVATVWGPTATPPEARAVVERLRKVPGVRSVVSQLYLAPAEPAPHSLPGPELMARAGGLANPPIITSLMAPAPRVPEPGTPTTSRREPPPAVAPEPVAAILPPVPAPEPELPLADRVEQARQRDRRFRNLRAEVRGGQVVVTGTVQHSRDAWDFGQSVQQLPGVTGVTLRAETSPP
jgi:osmotically-inducible protein OsmY